MFFHSRAYYLWLAYFTQSHPLVPLLLAPLVNGALTYFAHSSELVPAMVILVPWTTAAPIGAYIASGGS